MLCLPSAGRAAGTGAAFPLGWAAGPPTMRLAHRDLQEGWAGPKCFGEPCWRSGLLVGLQAPCLHSPSFPTAKGDLIARPWGPGAACALHKVPGAVGADPTVMEAAVAVVSVQRLAQRQRSAGVCKGRDPMRCEWPAFSPKTYPMKGEVHQSPARSCW